MSFQGDEAISFLLCCCVLPPFGIILNMEFRYGVHGPKEKPQNLQQDFKLSKRLQQKFI
jgi:hypothetical protein